MHATEVATLLRFCRVTVLSVAHRNRHRTFWARCWILARDFVVQLWWLRASLVDCLETVNFDRRLLGDIARARQTALLQPHDFATLSASETFLQGEIAQQRFWIRTLYRCSILLRPFRSNRPLWKVFRLVPPLLIIARVDRFPLLRRLWTVVYLTFQAELLFARYLWWRRLDHWVPDFHRWPALVWNHFV